MNSLEILRFAWTPSCLRLLLAAGSDAGPVQLHVWAWRAGLPRNHVKAAIVEAERLGGLKQEARAEGLALFVQPVSFWRVTPMMEAADWSVAWHGVAQSRLALVTEAVGLHEVLADGAHGVGRDQGSTESRPTSSPESGERRPQVHRNPVGFSAPMAPESGGFRDHVQDHDPVHDKTERSCLKHDHDASHRNPEGTTATSGRRGSSALPGEKSRARELIGTYLTGLTAQNAERWERRVHECADLVEFAIEEAASRRERLDSVAAYANRVYLSRIVLRTAAPAVRR